MQSTGQTSTHARSLTSIQGSAMMYATLFAPALRRVWAQRGGTSAKILGLCGGGERPERQRHGECHGVVVVQQHGGGLRQQLVGARHGGGERDGAGHRD